MAKENETANDELSFEQALAALEEIVQQLEQGKLGLTESLEHYESGVDLLKQCHTTLQQAARKIEVLTGVDEDGNAQTEPFSDTETTLQ
ncbi:MAG: exodeoxyribonuclease VII small subunit [Planctomycetota bacterium]|nr:exodeoxyribonuclease VII small subunit [Planctomycetota bacterium]